MADQTISVHITGSIHIEGEGSVRFEVFPTGGATWTGGTMDPVGADANAILEALAQVVYDKTIAEPSDAEADDDDSASEYVHEFKAQP